MTTLSFRAQNFNPLSISPHFASLRTSEKTYLPGYQLVHEGAIDSYCPTATTPQEALDQIVASPLNAMCYIQIYDGMGFKVYRRVQRPDSVLWDLEYVQDIWYRTSLEEVTR